MRKEIPLLVRILWFGQESSSEKPCVEGFGLKYEERSFDLFKRIHGLTVGVRIHPLNPSS